MAVQEPAVGSVHLLLFSKSIKVIVYCKQSTILWYAAIYVLWLGADVQDTYMHVIWRSKYLHTCESECDMMDLQFINSDLIYVMSLLNWILFFISFICLIGQSISKYMYNIARSIGINGNGKFFSIKLSVGKRLVRLYNFLLAGLTLSDLVWWYISMPTERMTLKGLVPMQPSNVILRLWCSVSRP
jgi:hypothetical protein